MKCSSCQGKVRSVGQSRVALTGCCGVVAGGRELDPESGRVYLRARLRQLPDGATPIAALRDLMRRHEISFGYMAAVLRLPVNTVIDAFAGQASEEFRRGWEKFAAPAVEVRYDG